jgi:SAM-dependent methyltransferase
MKEFWEARYATAEFVYGRSPNRFFSDALLRHPPGRILLPGEGEGRNAVFAAGLGWQVDAIDQSNNGAAKALELAASEGVYVNYTVGSLEHYSFKSVHYDMAALIFVHLPPSVRPWVHARIIEALKPGGWLVMEAFHTSQLGRDTGGPRSVDMLYDRALLLADFSGLEVLELEERLAELDEGPFHRGEAAVIRLIGRKPK